MSSNSCPNYNLPIYKKISDVYGSVAGKEIVDRIHDNTDFEKWYGRHSSTIPNFSKHKLFNDKGQYLDFRNLIVDSKDSYDLHIDNNINKYLAGTITKEELTSIYNQSDISGLSKRVQKLVNNNKGANIDVLVDNDYNRILQEDDTNLTIDEIKVKNGLKSKEDYYKYTSDINIVLSKLISKYNDDKIPYLYNYLEVDLQEFERIVNEVNNKCK
jgi:hypothetical protein